MADSEYAIYAIKVLREMIKQGSYQAAVEMANGDPTGKLADFIREPLERATEALKNLKPRS